MASASIGSLSTFGRRAKQERDGLDDSAQTEKLSSLPVDGSNERESDVPHGIEDSDQFKPHQDKTHRRLKPRHIQLIGIGGYVYGSIHAIQYVDSRMLRPLCLHQNNRYCPFCADRCAFISSH